jgi:hypothetical protein
VSKQEEDCPKYVLNDVCIERMKALDTKLKYLFGTSIITIALIIVQLARGG